MKILFIGLGSIGQRHLSNTKFLLKNKKIEYFYLKKTKKKLIIKNAKLLKKDKIEKFYKIKKITTYKKALATKPNVIFITNPSIFHYSDLIYFLEENKSFFIEKPLIISNKNLDRLIRYCKINNTKIVIGHQLRYHPGVEFIKKIIANKKYGTVKFARFINHTFLPSHHKYENFKEGFAARKKLGGGAINSLIHEIDLIAYLFGLPLSVKTFKNNFKILKIDVDEYSESFLKYKQNLNVYLSLSIIHGVEERFIELIFHNNFLKLDLNQNKIEIFDHNKKKIIFRKYFNLKRNKLFIDELKDFFLYLSENKKNIQSIEKTNETIKLHNLIKK